MTKLEEVKGITRLEVIDETGRKFVRWNCRVVKSVQDDSRTLKLFVCDEGKELGDE